MHTVGVLRGGPSSEHEASLKSGATMLANLDPDHYRARDIYIDKRGQWHVEGKPIAPEQVLRQIDVALMPLHGTYGESGHVQQLLEKFGVPYAASAPFPTYLAAHAVMSRAQLAEAGLRIPTYHLVESAEGAEAAAYEVTRSFHQPVVVRATFGGYAGAVVAGGYAPILDAVRSLFKGGAHTVLVEEYLRGKESVAGVVEELRGERLYALMPVELARGGPQCPGHFSRVEGEELGREAKVAHRTLGLRHASESHFMVTGHGVYYLGTTTLPALSPGESFMVALAAIGVTAREFIEHLLARSLP